MAEDSAKYRPRITAQPALGNDFRYFYLIIATIPEIGDTSSYVTAVPDTVETDPHTTMNE